MTESDCPHGFKIGKNRLPAGSYAAPIGTCRCCGTYFMYIAGGMMSTREQQYTAPDPTLCTQCGGKPRRRHVKDGVVLVDEPGTAADV